MNKRLSSPASRLLAFAKTLPRINRLEASLYTFDWKVDRKIEFLDEFQHIINETLESGVAAFLRDDDYQYYCGLPWPKRTRRDSKYAILFRACLSQTIDTVAHIPMGLESRLNVVLEAGSKSLSERLTSIVWNTSTLYRANSLIDRFSNFLHWRAFPRNPAIPQSSDPAWVPLSSK
jgi:hypothetical protein